MNTDEWVTKKANLIRSMKNAIETCDKPGLIIHGPPGCGKFTFLCETLQHMSKLFRVLSIESYGDQTISNCRSMHQSRQWINPLVLGDGDNIYSYIVDTIDNIQKNSQEDKELDIAFRHLFIQKPIMLISYDLKKVPARFKSRSNVFEVL